MFSAADKPGLVVDERGVAASSTHYLSSLGDLSHDAVIARNGVMVLPSPVLFSHLDHFARRLPLRESCS